MATKRLLRWRVVVICHEFVRYEALTDVPFERARVVHPLLGGVWMRSIHEAMSCDGVGVEVSVVWYAEVEVRAVKGEEYEVAERDYLRPLFDKSRKSRPSLSLSNWHISEVKAPRGRRTC